MVIGVEPHILLRLRLRPVLTRLCALGIFDCDDREDAMPEETDTPKPDLPDYTKKYFTDRHKDLKKLDRLLPETRDVLASLSPEEVQVLDRIGIALENDIERTGGIGGGAEVTEEYVEVETAEGDEIVEYAAESVSPGSSLFSYPFVVH
jgi:hypothetical protein